MEYSRVRNRRRAGNKRKPGKFGKKNTQNVQRFFDKKIKLENIRSPWKKFQNLINVGPLIRL